MLKEEIYKNAGRYNSDGMYSFTFDAGYVDLELSTTCCDYWDITKSKKKFTLFKGRTYKRCSLDKMDGKKILYVAIRSYEPSGEYGVVTIYSRKHFCKQKYFHRHNGYYPADFLYYTTLCEMADNKDDSDNSSDYNSDSD